MSPSPTGDSPPTALNHSTRPFPIPSRKSFHVDVPGASLISNGASLGLKSPSDLAPQRAASFSRDGMLGATGAGRPVGSSQAALTDSLLNGLAKSSSDEGSNPLKRRNTDVGVDYPRRRATIAVSIKN